MPSGAGAVCRVPAILHPEGRKASVGKLQGTIADVGLAVRCTEGLQLSGRTNLSAAAKEALLKLLAIITAEPEMRTILEHEEILAARPRLQLLDAIAVDDP